MLTVYVDADACPVKDEVYRVAARYGMPVKVVANAPLRVPAAGQVQLVVRPGFAAADDHIAGAAGAGDAVVTDDVPLAARCLAAGARVLDTRGRPFSPETIGEAMAVRDMMRGLRADGTVGGGPPPMAAKDRSRFLSKLDETLSALGRLHPPQAPPPATDS
jgi:uncharacterized protein YaiI (UPF0178 family)